MTETRTQILEVARDLYAQGGPDALSMRKVAQQIGISATAIYRHYKDKEALVMAVCEEGFRLFELSLLKGMRGRDPLSRLRLTGEGYMDFALEHEAYYRVMFMAPHPDFKRLQEETQLAFSPSFQLLIDRVSECQRAKLFKAGDPLPVATNIWAHVHGMIALWLDGQLGALGDEAQFKQHYLSYVDDLLDGYVLAATQASASGR